MYFRRLWLRKLRGWIIKPKYLAPWMQQEFRKFLRERFSNLASFGNPWRYVFNLNALQLNFQGAALAKIVQIPEEEDNDHR